MLPVATPPNAIVFAASDLGILEMILTGFVMNVLSVVVSLATFNVLGGPILGINQFPDWAESAGNSNVTDAICEALIQGK